MGRVLHATMPNDRSMESRSGPTCIKYYIYSQLNHEKDRSASFAIAPLLLKIVCKRGLINTHTGAIVISL